MKSFDREQNNSDNSESRIRELSDALDEAQRKLAERDALLAQALEQTETARAQYEQANARAESLRRQLSALQQRLQQHDDQVAAPDQIGAASKVPDLAAPVAQLSELGFSLESLDQPGTQYKITRPATTIGRSASNDIAIDSNSVSRFHARIDVEADGVFFVDLESTNGSKVNGKRVTRQRIGNADAISIGSTKFKFSIGAPADVESRAMQETHVLLNDSVILIPVPQTKARNTQ